MEAKNLIALIQALGTILLGAAAGLWTWWNFKIRQERYPHIETSADINFIGEHGDSYIVELIAYIENKGSVQHLMTELSFDLFGLKLDDPLTPAQEFGNQIRFPHKLADGAFLPRRSKEFFIDPGVKAKYSYVSKVPKDMAFVILHYWFPYGDERGYSHTAECTMKSRTPSDKDDPNL